MAQDKLQNTKPVLLFVNKTVGSQNLSRSDGFEKSRIFRHVQPKSKCRNPRRGSKIAAKATLSPGRRNQDDENELQENRELYSPQSDWVQQNQPSTLTLLVASTDGYEQSTLQYSLINRNEQLSQRLMVLLGGSKTPSRWLTYVPTYIDAGDQTLALAATAVLHARKAQLCGNPSEDSLASKNYSKCLTLLRTSITASGGCLLTIALLALYEQTALTTLKAWAAHINALAALLLGGGPSQCLGDLAPIFLYMTKGHRYLMPLANGTSSPFQRKLWLDMHPISSTVMTADIRRLKCLSNKIFILLPRLVAGMRQIREDDGSSLGSSDEITELLRLAAHLQKLKDPVAESAAMSNTTCEPTTNVRDSSLIPFSYACSNFETIMDLAVYWEARLAVANVCRMLWTTVEKSSPCLIWPWAPRDIEPNPSKEQERLSTNILMCLQSFAAAAASYIAFSSALLAVWRAISDLGGICGLDADIARAWLLSKFANNLGVPKNRRKVEVIDETCDMMVGGSLRGFWVDAFQKTNYTTQHD